MKALWRQYAARIDAMTLRERVFIFFCVAAALVVFVYSFWIDREFAKSKRLSDEIAQRQGESRSLQEQVAKMTSTRRSDPDRANRERLARAKKQLAEVETRIAAEERKFTAPDKMRAVLEELLAKNRRVNLVSLRTLPVTSIAEGRAAGGESGAAATKPPASAAGLIFRHSVELSISGGYLDVLAYLADLERLPTQLYWSALSLESRYPTVTVKLTVFTLSLDRGWLSV